MNKVKVRGIQITAKEVNTLSGFDKDVTYIKGFKEMTIDFTNGNNTIITLKELEAIVKQRIGRNPNDY